MLINVRWLKLAAVSVLIAGLAACAATASNRSSSEIRIVGSDSMLPLNRHLATVYMQSHPGAAVVVSGGGTGIGAQALIDQTTDLCAASTALQADEIENLFNNTGSLGVRFLVALDAVAIYLHQSNPLDDLSMNQLAKLFDGTVTNWSEIGGPSRPVTPVIRPPTSGTHRFFRNLVLGEGTYSASALTAYRTLDVVAAVAADPGAIGFGGLAYDGEIKHASIDGAAPDPDAIRQGRYPLARYLYYFAAIPPQGLTEDFVNWVLGEQGQHVVEDVGLVALWGREH